MIKNESTSISSVYYKDNVIGKIMKGLVKVYEAWKNLLLSGIPPLALPKCKGVPLLDYKIYGDSVQGKLPSEYQQVEYIENTGIQSIDTGVIPNNNTGVDITYQALNISSSQYILGVRDDTINFAVNGSLSRTDWDVRFDGVAIYSDINRTTDKIRTQISMLDKKWTITNITTGESKTINIGDRTITTTIPMHLFAYNKTIEYAYSVIHTSLRVFACKIYDGEILVRDFIPCYRKSDNEIGMYDLVNNAFHTNIGTGTFLKGNNAPSVDAPLEVESVGDKTKNLFNKNTISLNKKLYLGRVEDDENRYVSDYIDCENVSSVSINLAGSFSWYDKNKAIVSSENKSVTTFRNYAKPSGAVYLRLDFAKATITPDEVMCVSGKYTQNTMPPHEPYGYRIPVKASGKNLFKSTGNVLGSLDVTTGDTSSPSLYNYITTSDFIPLKAGTYTISYKTGVNLRHIALYNENKEIVNYFWSNRANPYKFTIAKDYLVRIDFERVGKVAIENFETFFTEYQVQLEKGSTATDYSPYAEPITTNIYLNEPLRKLGEYADYIDFKNKKVVRNICEEKPKYQYILNFAQAFTTVLSKPALNTDNTKRYVRCNYMKGSNGLPVASERAGTVFIGSNDKYVGFGETELFPIADTQFATEEEHTVFSVWLNSTNVLVAYVLKTPEEETIELPNIPTNKGTTIIEVDTTILPSNMEVVYKGKK